jgi:BMFP domain-containing protein YqiC
MSVVEDTRKIIQDFLTPELRELKARVESLEGKVDDNERRAERRHDEVMTAIRQVQDYTTLSQRVARLESKETHAQ